MKIKRSPFSIQLCLFIVFVSINCSEVYAQAKNIFFNNYSEKVGLSGNYVTTIIQDDDGYLWVGTKNGLNRFDGYEFKTYKKTIDSKGGINNNYIKRLFLDSHKRMWVLTFAGVQLYDKQHDNFISFDGMFLEKKIEASGIAEDAEHNFWISTIGDGIFKLNADLKSVENFLPGSYSTNKNADSKKNLISNLIINKQGDLWLASYNGLLLFNPVSKLFTAYPFKYADSLNRKYNNLFMNLYADLADENTLWCGTWGAGLLQFDIAQKRFTQFKYEYSTPPNLSNIVYQCLRKDKNELWLATEKGLMIYNTTDKSFFIYTHRAEEEHSFSGSSALCIFKGSDRKMWIGSASGFSLMNPEKQFFSYTAFTDIGYIGLLNDDTLKNYSYIVSIYNNRALWIVNNLTSEIKKFPLPQADEFNAEPFCMLTSGDSLFIGTTKGLYLFNKQTNKVQLLDIATSLGVDKNQLSVYDIIKDGGGNIFLACHNISFGLLKLNRHNGINLSVESVGDSSLGFSFNGINRFEKDASGNIWFVSDNSLVKMNGVTHHFDFFNGVENKKYKSISGITDLTFDKKGNIWLSTEENGLLLFDSAFNLTAFNTFNGNRIEFLSSICCDLKNNIWVNGAQGLFQFNTANSTFRNFTSADGLPAENSQSNLQFISSDKISFTYGDRIYSLIPIWKKHMLLIIH